jgi:hypothetical protein
MKMEEGFDTLLVSVTTDIQIGRVLILEDIIS